MVTRPALVVLFAFVAVCALPVASPASLDLGVGMFATDVSLGEALLVAGMAAFLGFDTQAVLYYHSSDRLPYSSVLTALLLSRMSGADHHRVTSWRGQGRGWGRIARDLGLHPGAFNQFRKGLDIDRMGDDDFERLIVTWYLAKHYAVEQSRIDGWHQGGRPLLDILIALDLGAKSHRQVADLFDARRRSGSWDEVADRVGVGRSARWRAEAPKAGKEFRGRGRGGDQGEGPRAGERSRGIRGSAEPRGGDDRGHSPGGPGRGHGKGRGGGHRD